MKNIFMETAQAPIETHNKKYSFVGDICYGRRIVGIYSDKMHYAIAVKEEAVSPWFDKITIMPSFNICQKDGKYFLTSANGISVISEEYKELGRFEKIGMLEKYYAKAKNLEGKYGTICSDGKIGIEFSQNELKRFGTVFAVCGKKFDNQIRYAIYAVNGERIADYEYVKYKILDKRALLQTADGKMVICNSLGILKKLD